MLFLLSYILNLFPLIRENPWLDYSCPDWEVAIELVSINRFRHGLYFAHLALEKILKAHVCKETHDLAPKIHNLIDLTQLTTCANSCKFRNKASL
jgi:HEPN domain-containing protein